MVPAPVDTSGSPTSGDEPTSPTDNGDASNPDEPTSPGDSPGGVKRTTKFGSFMEAGRRTSIHDSPTSLASRTRKAWLSNCRKVFDEFDSDGGGTIDISEFGALLDNAGLHFAPEDIRRICEEFDKNSDGEIDFEEFTSFLEAHGMGPGGTSGSMSMTDALRAINTQVKSSMMTISDRDQQSIESQAKPCCVKGHPLEKVSIGELQLEKFYFGLGGFVCGKCTISSDNLVNKAAYLCSNCQWVICSMCASLVRQEGINTEIRKRTTLKAQSLWAFSEAGKRKSRQSAGENVVRRGRKEGGQLKFGAGGMRMSMGSKESVDGTLS